MLFINSKILRQCSGNYTQIFNRRYVSILKLIDRFHIDDKVNDDVFLEDILFFFNGENHWCIFDEK